MLRAEVRHLPLQRVSAPPSAIRAFLEEHRQELLGVMAAAGGAGLRLSRRHAAIMDSLLVQLFQGALACTPGASSNVVLGAVGGYGRQLLAWKSDLDIRFITVGSTKALGKQVDAVLYPLWDAGMSIGHQVVSVADVVEAARHDLPTATALLDLRVLAGDARIAAALSERAYATLFSEARLPKFLDRLEAQTEARQQRYGDSVYLLEPDVKSGRGGLRDIDCALWAARARFRTSDLKELEKLDLLSARQVEQVSAAADFLWAIRNHLHARAARRSDRLTFAEQEALAPRLGYGVAARPGVSEVQRIGVAVEEMMSDYYRHARNIARVREQLIGRARRREPKRFSRSVVLGPGLVKSEGGVALRDPADLARNPVIALRLYATAVEHDLPVLSRTRDAIAHAASEPAFGEALRGNAEASSAFISLVACSRSARFRNGSILGELHEVGLLLAMIPEFTPVVGRVHHDMYHVYTVDVHSVAAVDRLHALVRGDLVATQPLACRLAAEVARPQVLFMATLLHDVGKAIGGHDHSRRGAEMARSILARLGMPADDVDAACALIAHHLLMYMVAVQRDIADTATLDKLLQITRDREGLRDLYLLTVADLSTTSPTSMTTWKAGMLDALMRRGEARLSELPADPGDRLSRARAQVKVAWAGRGAPEEIDAFLDGMPERYLLATPPAVVIEHARAALGREIDAITATLLPSPHAEVAQLCVVTDAKAGSSLCVVAPDQPGLLASIAAAISANGLEIHAAEINTRPLAEGGVQAVDVFWVRSPRGVSGIAERLGRLQHDLRQSITGQVNHAQLLARATGSWPTARSLPPVFTEIVLDHAASHEHTVIEVLTADRPGLLFTLSQALHEIGISIHLAKINTEGSRVIDVFYVTGSDGKKLAPGEPSERVRQHLHAALLD